MTAKLITSAAVVLPIMGIHIYSYNSKSICVMKFDFWSYVAIVQKI